MDPRRKRTLALASVPASLSGMMLPLMQHFHGSRALPYVVLGTLVCMAVPLALAVKNLAELKRDGNPY